MRFVARTNEWARCALPLTATCVAPLEADLPFASVDIVCGSGNYRSQVLPNPFSDWIYLGLTTRHRLSFAGQRNDRLEQSTRSRDLFCFGENMVMFRLLRGLSCEPAGPSRVRFDIWKNIRRNFSVAWRGYLEVQLSTSLKCTTCPMLPQMTCGEWYENIGSNDQKLNFSNNMVLITAKFPLSQNSKKIRTHPEFCT
jgi:hypothetical protein